MHEKPGLAIPQRHVWASPPRVGPTGEQRSSRGDRLGKSPRKSFATLPRDTNHGRLVQRGTVNAPSSVARTPPRVTLTVQRQAPCR